MGKAQKPLELKPLTVECNLAYRFKATYADILSGHIVRRLDLKRAACFVYVFFFLYYRWMVDGEVDGQHVFSFIVSSTCSMDGGS